MRLLRTMLFAAATALSFAGGTANAASVTWNGPSDFDTASITFTGFTANRLTSFSGDGYFHSHGNGSITSYLDIRLNSVWTNIFSASTSSVGKNAGNSYSSLISNVAFASGTVSGIRLRTSLVQSQTYHLWSMSTQDTFNFDNVSEVPLPAGFPLLAASLVGFGVIARRRKQS